MKKTTTKKSVKFWERTRYFLAIAWMNTLGALPLLIKGIYLWRKSSEIQKKDTLLRLGLLFGFVSILFFFVYGPNLHWSWCLPLDLGWLVLITYVIWEFLFAIHGEGVNPLKI